MFSENEGGSLDIDSIVRAFGEGSVRVLLQNSHLQEKLAEHINSMYLHPTDPTTRYVCCVVLLVLCCAALFCLCCAVVLCCVALRGVVLYCVCARVLLQNSHRKKNWQSMLVSN